MAADDFQQILCRPRYTVRHSRMRLCEFQPHSHTELTVTCLLAGRLLASIDHAAVVLSPGLVGFTNAGQVHSGKGQSVEFISLDLAYVFVAEVIAEIGSIRSGTEFRFRAPSAEDASLYLVARNIAREMVKADVGREAMLDTLARQAVVLLIRSHLVLGRSPLIEMSRAGAVDRRLRRALEFMHDNYSRELDLAEIAAAAYLSEYHFARIFKQITGVTPHVYLANLRLEKARKLLVQTALPISEIAAMVGYQSQSHFARIFKSVTGLAPRDYRGPRREIQQFIVNK